MENILSGLKVVSGEVKPTTVREGFGLEVSADVKLTKGNFEKEINFWARIYETQYKGVIGIEEYDITDVYHTKIGELVIDDIHKLKTQLTQSGLSTLSNSLGLTYDEERFAIYKVVENHKTIKLVYGKKTRIWELLSEDEQKILELQYAVENYETCGDYFKQNVAKFFGFDKTPNDETSTEDYVPSLDAFKLKLAELSK
jgi:hypothetical protein